MSANATPLRVGIAGLGRMGRHHARTLAHGHEASTEMVGTAGAVSVGVGAHRDRVRLRERQGVRHIALADFHERFREAFDTEMADFVAACRGEKAPALSLADATEATCIAVAIAKLLHSGQVEPVL